MVSLNHSCPPEMAAIMTGYISQLAEEEVRFANLAQKPPSAIVATKASGMGICEQVGVSWLGDMVVIKGHGRRGTDEWVELHLAYCVKWDIVDG